MQLYILFLEDRPSKKNLPPAGGGANQFLGPAVEEAAAALQPLSQHVQLSHQQMLASPRRLRQRSRSDSADSSGSGSTSTRVRASSITGGGPNGDGSVLTPWGESLTQAQLQGMAIQELCTLAESIMIQKSVTGGLGRILAAAADDHDVAENSSSAVTPSSLVGPANTPREIGQGAGAAAGEMPKMLSRLDTLVVPTSSSTPSPAEADQRKCARLIALILHANDLPIPTQTKWVCTYGMMRDGAMFGALTVMCIFFVNAAELGLEVGGIALVAGLTLAVGTGVYTGNRGLFADDDDTTVIDRNSGDGDNAEDSNSGNNGSGSRQQDGAAAAREAAAGVDAEEGDGGGRQDSYTVQLLMGIDYPLLLIFAGQFIQIQGLVGTGTPKCVWDAIIGWDADHPPMYSLSDTFLLAIVVVLLSNAISNVPLVLLMKPMLDDVKAVFGPERASAVWLMVAFVCTIAGNFVLTGSAANLIVAENGEKEYEKMIRDSPTERLAGLLQATEEQSVARAARDREGERAGSSGESVSPRSLFQDITAGFGATFGGATDMADTAAPTGGTPPLPVILPGLSTTTPCSLALLCPTLLCIHVYAFRSSVRPFVVWSDLISDQSVAYIDLSQTALTAAWSRLSRCTPSWILRKSGQVTLARLRWRRPNIALICR